NALAPAPHPPDRENHQDEQDDVEDFHGGASRYAPQIGPLAPSCKRPPRVRSGRCSVRCCAGLFGVFAGLRSAFTATFATRAAVAATAAATAAAATVAVTVAARTISARTVVGDAFDGFARLLVHRLHREANLAAIVEAEELHLHGVALFHHVAG